MILERFDWHINFCGFIFLAGEQEQSLLFFRKGTYMATKLNIFPKFSKHFCMWHPQTILLSLKITLGLSHNNFRRLVYQPYETYT